MKSELKLPRLGRMLLSMLVLGTAAPAVAHAQGVAQQAFKAGEIILYMQPGTPKADALALAAKVQPQSVVPLLLQDCYVVYLPAARKTANDTTQAVATLKADPRVRWCNGSPIYKYMQSSAPKVTPNDPKFNTQWNMQMINMPQAWALWKGAAPFKVAWIDSGFDPKHEDFQGKLDPSSYDFADNDPDVTADGTGVGFDHGTSTSSVAFANTNNALGLAGIDGYPGLVVVGLKTEKKGGSGPDGPAILNSYAYILANKDKLHIVAVNMSYGTPGGDPNDTNNPEYVATKALADAGVLMIASAGNFATQGNPTNTPAYYAHCISVAALGSNGKTASYSEFGKVEIAAPGGNMSDTGNAADGVPVFAQNSAYITDDGTSFSAPHVSGVAGLLMSVPGVTAAIAKDALLSTANHTGLGSLPDAHYGFGTLDAYAALLKVSVTAIIEDPQGIDPTGKTTSPNGQAPPPVETLKPILRFKVANIPPANVTITIDKGQPTQQVFTGAVITSNIESGNTSGANPQYVIAFPLVLSVGQHEVDISGTNPNSGTTTTDTRIFSIVPHVLPGGVQFISIPYYESAADSPTHQLRDVGQLLDPNATLFRWVNMSVTDSTGHVGVQGHYLSFNGTSGGDPNASLQQVSTASAPIENGNPPMPVLPLGLAFFINAPAPITVQTYGRPNTTTTFSIPLQEGWNMVGDPYNFAVPFDSAQIQVSPGNVLTIEQAVDQHLVLPFLYHFVGGQYAYDTLPAGQFNPWEGHWLFVIPKSSSSISSGTALTLILSPTAINGLNGASRAAKSRAASVASAPVLQGAGSWMIQLEAHAGNLKDGNVSVGMTTRASATDERTKVPKPPLPSPYVSVGIARPNSPAGLYVQDLQPVGGIKTWNIVVGTDKANTDVTVDWPGITSVPRNYRLTLEDNVSGQVVDLKHTGSYQFNSGHSAGTRSFTLTARPTNNGGRAVFTNIVVNPRVTRGSGSPPTYEIGYTVSQDVQVEVSILSLGGHVLSQVTPTRAVSSGDNNLVWNGRDSAGRTIPAGPYALQLRAITSDGQVTREIRPFIITGR